MIAYTAIFDNYDTLKPPHPKSDCPHFCFTDGDPRCDGWTVVQVERQYSSPTLDARRVKILGPWEYLPSNDVSLWIDGSVEMKQPPSASMAEELLDDAEIACFHHRWNDCIKEEGRDCIRFGKDDPAIIQQQVDAYIEEGMPEHYGVSLTGVLFRRATTEHFCRLWWQQVRSGSYRDQLSFDYCRWKTGIQCSQIPGTICSNPLVRHYPKHPKQ